jgi:hypothetical protein
LAGRLFDLFFVGKFWGGPSVAGSILGAQFFQQGQVVVRVAVSLWCAVVRLFRMRPELKFEC